jgi:ABC-2 type transport system permease protein
MTIHASITARTLSPHSRTASFSVPGAFQRVAVLLRLELFDALRSRWLAFTIAAYALVFGAFVWLGLRESSVLGFTGISRVVLNASNAVVVVLPLVALVATCQAVPRARSTGYFETFAAQPCRRSDWLWAIVLSRMVVLAGPLVLLLGAAWLASGYGEPALGGLILRTLMVTLALVIAFIGIGLAVSVSARSAERAVVGALLVWLIVSALHDFALIGFLLEQRIEPWLVFALSGANPVEAARLALLSGIDPELSVLGPVGFWIANTLGPDRTLACGVLWPVLLGALALLFAYRRLNKADLAG